MGVTTTTSIIIIIIIVNYHYLLLLFTIIFISIIIGIITTVKLGDAGEGRANLDVSVHDVTGM